MRSAASIFLALVALAALLLRSDHRLQAENSPEGAKAPAEKPAAVDPAAKPSTADAPTEAVFASKVRPMIARYCLGCHSEKVKKGDLDLERFVSLDVARRDLKPWQSLIEMVGAEEMPPKEKPQPSAEERKFLLAWTHDWLEAEARAHVGDPGPAALRRLSNAEYDATIRDLTGVDLRPAREFPADGAAGEGFTNAAEALSMSPALVEKYLAAAKGVADHVVLLPDGIRFSPSSHQRDWVDEALGSLHALYNQYAEPEGQLPLRRYLAVLVQNRAALAAGKASLADIARQERLSPKYLATLWNELNDAHPSPVMDDVRARWKTATPADVAALADEIEAWQKLVWKLVNNNAGLFEVWQQPNAALTDSQIIRFRIDPPSAPTDVVVYLVAKNVGKSSSKPLVLWDKARLEMPNQPPLLLRDVPAVAQQIGASLHGQFVDTAKYLAAVAQWRRDPAAGPLSAVAKARALDVKRLQNWVDAVGLQRDVLGPPEPLTVKKEALDGRPSISGWGSPTNDQLPSLFANNADMAIAIPGTVPPHGVTVHPTPDEYVAVSWTSPIEGSFVVETKVADAHAGCGNGVAWWLDVLRNERRDRLTNGDFDDGKAATIAPRTVAIKVGDTLSLSIGARNRDHTCDLTLVDLTIKEVGGKGRVWNLSRDVADTVLAGNPHADTQGNKDVWRFSRGRDSSSGAKRTVDIPADSLLMKWREAVEQGKPLAEAAKLADEVQASLVTDSPATTKASGGTPPKAANLSPEARLFLALSSPGSPLVEPIDVGKILAARDPKHPGPAVVSRYGLDPARFGKHPSGRSIDESSIVSESPSVIEIRLPALLAANRELVVDTRIDPATVGAAFVQVQALNAPADKQPQLAGAPILYNAQGQGREELDHALQDFRTKFPLMLCFGRVVPEDPDGITLSLFCREDEPLSRLMLDTAQQQRLDRLWSELKYISREAIKEYEAYPLFMGFASQVGLVPRFKPLAEPVRLRMEEFKGEMLASEPKHLEAILDFAARAYRHPLQDHERNELLALYQALRKKQVPHEDAVRGVYAKILVAPAFLYHLEEPPSGTAPKPVNDWELASRLSYFLWSTIPDEELRRVAASGHLHEPEVLADQTKRMLKSDRLRALAIEFGTQWVHVRGFDQLNEKNEKLFPMFNEQLRGAIYEESIRFFQDLFQADRPVTDLLDSDHTFVNETLAKHYGIPNVVGTEWRRIDGVRKYGRGGLLGLASIQAVASGASRTSPVLRGNWVVETLLGEKMPRPPPDVPKLRDEESGADGLSVRQLVEQHAKVAQCAICHRRMDPFGFSMEHYDTIGRFREKEASGAAIDAHATLKDGTKFEGLDGLRNYLLTKKRDVVLRLFCKRLLGYSLGRETGTADQPVVDEMLAAMQRNDGRLSAAVLTIVASPKFRLIRGGDYALPEVSETQP